MEYLQVILLVLIFGVVQGYNNTRNETFVQRNSVYNALPSDRQWKYFHNKKQFDDAFLHYRSDDLHSHNRQSRFISFNSKDDNIDVELDFAVPFLSIPVKRALDTAMSSFNGLVRGFPMAQVNFGALGYLGLVIALGATISGISRVVSGGNFLEIIGGTIGYPPYQGYQQQKNQRRKDFVKDDGSFQWIELLYQIENGFGKFDIDSTACTQRLICWHVKDSLANVAEQKATNFDYVISGLINSDWALQMISNPSWISAISTGRSGGNCEKTYSLCKLNPNNVENLSKKVMQYANLKK